MNEHLQRGAAATHQRLQTGTRRRFEMLRQRELPARRITARQLSIPDLDVDAAAAEVEVRIRERLMHLAWDSAAPQKHQQQPERAQRSRRYAPDEPSRLAAKSHPLQRPLLIDDGGLGVRRKASG
jgi:hypothetical protein